MSFNPVVSETLNAGYNKIVIVNNESKTSFSTTPLLEQIDIGVAKTNSFAI